MGADVEAGGSRVSTGAGNGRSGGRVHTAKSMAEDIYSQDTIRDGRAVAVRMEMEWKGRSR